MKITDDHYCKINDNLQAFPIAEDYIFDDTNYHNWHFSGVHFKNTLFRDILSNNRSPSFFWCCVFEDCSMEGKIAKIKLNSCKDWDNERTNNAPWKKCLKEKYEKITVAVDISRARFTTGIDLNCVPGEKIIINNQDQVLVKTSEIQRQYNNIIWGDSAWRIGCKWAIDDSIFEYMVIFAAGGKRSYDNDMELIQELRKMGLVHKSSCLPNIKKPVSVLPVQ